MLKGESIYLRAVEKEDASTLFIWENNPSNWKISNTEIPFSMHSIHQLIEQQYTQLGGLTNIGQASAVRQAAAGQQTGLNVANLLANQGAAIAGGQVARGNVGRQTFGDILGVAKTVAAF